MTNFFISLPDQPARAQALDPAVSFIVQAPAGSGKTELLIQRILVLLAQVKQPEEILAITFTRKAAAEMQARLLNALQNAATATEPETTHTKKTWQLARAALQQDTQQQWHLLDNPSRLQIQTIDSFCNKLVQQLPLLSGLGSNITITDDASVLYQKAVANLFADLEQNTQWTAALSELLLHLDNNYLTLERLLTNMLARREQWLPHVVGKHVTKTSQVAALRQHLERALTQVTLDKLTKLSNTLPDHLHQNLPELLRFAATNLHAAGKQTALAACINLTELPSHTLDDIMYWRGIAELLLTEDQWRKQIRVDQGFPAEKDDLHKTMKARMRAVLEQCTAHDDFREALYAIAQTPATIYNDQQWRTIAGLLELLPVLVAHLNVVFQLHGEIDHSEILQRALLALGELENPSDLALRLDYRLQHILVDEFQDTAVSQFQLLEHLTAGWQMGDGRSLFLVGDPMQSIYRFRKAEVGLFLRAQEQGIGHIRLQPLVLSTNFRAHTGLVNWYNQTFQIIFPKSNDLTLGAIGYSPANAVHPELAEAIFLHAQPQTNPNAEATQITQIITAHLQQTKDTRIAILVRNRNHLQAILPALQAANIPYRAPELISLNQQHVIQDLMSLTKAMLDPANKLAWLSVLRAPWCGLLLTDLHALVHGITENMSQSDQVDTGPSLDIIWEHIKQHTTLKLSSDGHARVKRIHDAIAPLLQQRQRLALRLWIESAWLALGGPACLQQATELKDVAQFFNLLDQFNYQTFDSKTLENSLRRLFAASDNDPATQVDIMTIHKAKGLEFDVVILPGLGRRNRSDDPQLLLWSERPNLIGGIDLLFAPIKASHEKSDSIYDYLRREETSKAYYETARLLYVAATRARRQLHLLGHVECELDKPEAIKPPGGSLLETLWPSIKTEFIALLQNNAIANTEEFTENLPQSLHRLPSNWQNPLLQK